MNRPKSDKGLSLSLSLAGPVPDRSAPLAFRCRRRCRRCRSHSRQPVQTKGLGPTRPNRNQALSSPGLSACRLPRAPPAQQVSRKRSLVIPAALGLVEVRSILIQARAAAQPAWSLCLVSPSVPKLRTASCLPMGRPDRLGPAHTSLASTCRCLLAAPPFFVGPNLRPGRRLGTNVAVADFVSRSLSPSPLHPFSLPASSTPLPARLWPVHASAHPFPPT